MTRVLVFVALVVLVALALRRRPTSRTYRIGRDRPLGWAPVTSFDGSCPDLSELSYGDLPSWPSVRVG